MKIRIVKKKKLDEMSAMGGGAVQGHVDNREEINETTHVESNVKNDDEYEYSSFITVHNTDLDYKVTQELVIDQEKVGSLSHTYQELSDEIIKCVPNALVQSDYGRGQLVYSEISFHIEHMEKNGKPIADLYDLEENIYLNKMDSLRFFKQVMKEIGQYISKHLDKVYRFIGMPSVDETNDSVATKRTQIYQMGLKRLFRSFPGNWKSQTVGSPNNLFFWRCPDGEQANLVFENKEIEFTNEEIDLIHEMYSTSGAMMGSGSGQIPKERNPEAHKRYVRMRHEKQGLKNFKPNRYFAESEEKPVKIKIKIRKNLGERCQKGYKTHPKRKTKKMFGKTYRNCVKAEGKMSKSYCEKTPCDEMGFSQRASCAKHKNCPSPKKKNEAKDPKKGTGKKPKGSGRRLYTDENPKDTVSVKFSTVQDVKDTFSKASFKSKSHKRQSQIINLVHQRARAAYQNAKDPKAKKRLKKAYEYAKKRKEASKEKTKRMNK